jgi:hypothetical protein
MPEDAEAWYAATFDPKVEPASDAVVATLSDALGVDVDQLEPIDSVVDPIVLDALVRRQRRPVRISFVYNDHEVTVDTVGETRIREPTD